MMRTNMNLKQKLDIPSAILVKAVQCRASTDLHATSWRASTSNGVYLAARSAISTCQFKPLLGKGLTFSIIV